MHHSRQLSRLKPIVAVLTSAYTVLGLLTAAKPALATSTIIPAGTTLTSTQTLVSASYTSFTDSYTNDGTIHPSGASGLMGNAVTLGTLSNTGLISSGTNPGVNLTNAQVGSMSNSGTIAGSNAFYMGGGSTMSSMSNTGLISGSSYAVGLDTGVTVGTLTNSGTLTGNSMGYGYVARATLGTLVNSGLIQGGNKAIYSYSPGTLGTIVNTGTIAGVIDSNRPLTIAGGATQGTLTGANMTSVGSMTITTAGVLFFSGSQLLNDNITLIGNYTVNNVGAVLQINNPINIVGNYAQSANAGLVVGVSDTAVATGVSASDSGYGRLIVSGSASIASGSSVSLIRTGSSYAFASGQRYVVISASSSGTNYNADTLRYSASGFGGTVSGSAVSSGSTSSLVVSLSSPVAPTVVATTPNAVSALTGLSRYSGTSSGLLDLYNASLALSSTGEANKVGEQLSPMQSTHVVNAASVATLDVLNVVGQHADSVRLASVSGRSGLSSGDSYVDWQGWGQFFGGKASQGTIDGVSGYNANYSGMVIGADRMFGERWRAGAAFSYSGTKVKGANNVSGNTSQVDSWGVIGYASYYGNPWYLNLSASINRQNYHTDRLVSLPGYSDTAKANFKGDQYVLKSEFGYPLAGAWNSTVTPLAALSYSNQQQNGYTETSMHGSALKVGSTNTEAVRGGLGGKISKSWFTRYGELTPSAQLMWTHQFNKNRTSVTSGFVSDPTGETSFTSQSATPVQDTADLSLGLTLQQRDNLSLTARYDRQDGEHYHAQTFSLKVRKEF